MSFRLPVNYFRKNIAPLRKLPGKGKDCWRGRHVRERMMLK